MNKFSILIVVVLLTITGCAVQVIDNSSINGIIKTVMANDYDRANRYYNGYKFYLPRGMKITEEEGYNFRILYNGEIYYFYVDIVSYYYKTKVDYNINSTSYYSDIIDYDDKYGYIEINEVDDKYFVEVVYNYAKIEAYVKKDKIGDALTNVCMLLSSIQYNDSVLETIIGDKSFEYEEELYDDFLSQRETGNFLDYAQ